MFAINQTFIYYLIKFYSSLKLCQKWVKFIVFLSVLKIVYNVEKELKTKIENQNKNQLNV